MEHWWNIRARGELETRRQTCPIATWSTTGLCSTGLASNTGLRRQRPEAWHGPYVCVNGGKYSTLNTLVHFAVILYEGRICPVRNFKITARFTYQLKVVPADIRFVIHRLMHIFILILNALFTFLLLNNWSKSRYVRQVALT